MGSYCGRTPAGSTGDFEAPAVERALILARRVGDHETPCAGRVLAVEARYRVALRLELPAAVVRGLKHRFPWNAHAQQLDGQIPLVRMRYVDVDRQPLDRPAVLDVDV